MTTKTTNGQPFVPYIRVSRVGGRDKRDGYISKPEQLRKIQAVASAAGVELLEEAFEDENRSGGNVDRERFQQAVDLVREGKAGGIAVATIDRFSRNTEDALPLIREIEGLGGRVLAHDRGDYLSVDTPTEEFVVTLLFGVGTMDLGMKKKGLKDSVRNAVGRGIHLSAPYGYRKAKGDRGAQPLELDPVEAPIVERMFRERAAGRSWSEIARRLNDEGIPARRAPQWRHQSVRTIVVSGDSPSGSSVYLGTAWNGEHETLNAHPAIVSTRLFNAANRSRGTKHANRSESYLLGGLLRCTSCGSVMTHQPAKDGRYRYYRCPGQSGRGACPARVNVPAPELEAWVWEQFVSEYVDVKFVVDDSSETVLAAQEAVEAGKAAFKVAFAAKVSLGEAASATELELVEEELEASRAALRQAESYLAKALMRERHADLPVMTLADAESAPIEEKKHWLSLAWRCLAVRRGKGLAPADRVRFVFPEDVGADGVIAHVVALNW